MDKKAFGKQLQLYRERAGYSQEALAEQIECSTIFISYIERGEKSPSLDTLVKRKGQILRPTPNTAPLICGACYNTQPEDLLTMA